MELLLESDLYEPCLDECGNYTDVLPSSSKFAHGLRCPCGTRQDHIFDNRTSFGTHLKSKTHQKWIQSINNNKMNYFVECQKLTELTNCQKLIIARIEKELSKSKHTIISLAHQLYGNTPDDDDVE